MARHARKLACPLSASTLALTSSKNMEQHVYVYLILMEHVSAHAMLASLQTTHMPTCLRVTPRL
jgi:hypothetical protein